MRRRAEKQPLEIFFWRISIGVALKIRYIFPTPELIGNAAFGVFYLLENGRGGLFGEVAAAVCAENTALRTESAVAVGTGHTAVQSEFVYFFTELLPREFVKRIISVFHKFILA